jgi:hypothetical protein
MDQPLKNDFNYKKGLEREAWINRQWAEVHIYWLKPQPALFSSVPQTPKHKVLEPSNNKF